VTAQRSRSCGIHLPGVSGEDPSRELTMRPLSRLVRGSGSFAPVLLFSGVGPPAGGGSLRRTADDGRRRRAGRPVAAAATGSAGLDSDAHDTANAAGAGCPSAVGGRDAHGGASVARLPLPRLDDMVHACGVERADGVAQGRRRGRSPAVAAGARDGLTAAVPVRRTPRDRSRSGCSPMTRPAFDPGRSSSLEPVHPFKPSGT
jgi:hypothetical protein